MKCVQWLKTLKVLATKNQGYVTCLLAIYASFVYYTVFIVAVGRVAVPVPGTGLTYINKHQPKRYRKC